jgi:hypothetical protein
VTVVYYLWAAVIVIAFALFTEPKSKLNLLPHGQPLKVVVLLAMGALTCALVHYPRVFLEEYLVKKHQREFEEVKRRVHFFTA